MVQTDPEKSSNMDILRYHGAGTVCRIPRPVKERRWMKAAIKKKASAFDMWYAFVLIGIFFVMLVCNLLTKFLADDFAYLFSFADGSRIEHLSQIIPSMAAHAKSMNGRLTAHSLVQLFVIFPTWVFDVVNALMCVSLVWGIESLSRGQWKRSPLMAATVFCGIWFFFTFFWSGDALARRCNQLPLECLLCLTLTASDGSRLLVRHTSPDSLW